MKNLLSFTLAAGVAITTTSVAYGAGVQRAATNTQKNVSTRIAPAGVSSSAILDRTSLNRELTRISDLLSPVSDELGFGGDSVAVTKKVSPSFTF